MGDFDMGDFDMGDFDMGDFDMGDLDRVSTLGRYVRGKHLTRLQLHCRAVADSCEQAAVRWILCWLHTVPNTIPDQILESASPLFFVSLLGVF